MSSCISIPFSRALLHITLSILCLLGVAISRPTQNITIDVPTRTTNNAEQSSLSSCIPATWIDIANYFLFNYVAHGATVVSYPGEPLFDTLLSVVAAILFPTSGVIRSLNFIIRRPLLTAKNDLEVAARSGALCMLVRSSSWKPQQGDDIRNALIKNPGNVSEPSLRAHNTSSSNPNVKISPTTVALSVYTPPWLNDRTHFWSYTDTDLVEIGSRAVFGLIKPPDQYKFVFVPRNTEVLPLASVDPTSAPSSNVPDIMPPLRYLFRIFASQASTTKLSSSFNLFKGMSALLQSLYASFTFFRTNGGQAKRYGFAAPGFTVLPYAVVSALNLVASLVTPHYPKLHLVRSKVMEEAERRTGLTFPHVVGKVADESDTDNIVKEGWSEIAGSFKDHENMLRITPAAEEDERIVIRDSSSQTIYVPACPKFRRTDSDDSQIPPLLQFIESRTGSLLFPRHMGRSKQALALPSLFSFSPLSSQLHLPSGLGTLLQRSWQFVSTNTRRALHIHTLNLYEISLIIFIIGAEFSTTLALSNFSIQQSTPAQVTWVVMWLITGYTFGAFIYSVDRVVSKMRKKVSPMLLGFGIYCYMAIFCTPAIGGFVVVLQMLKAYGICSNSD